MEYIDARRAEVEQALAAILPPMPHCPQVVYDAMAYSLLAGGKRLRPILCLASADAVGGDRAMALPAACAHEGTVARDAGEAHTQFIFLQRSNARATSKSYA